MTPPSGPGQSRTSPRWRPPARTRRRLTAKPGCPDCTATWQPPGPCHGPRLVHKETCPSAVALDAVTDVDRDCFTRHPGKPFRWRRVTRAEVTDVHLQAPDEPLAPGWWVRVTDMPWGRVRTFCLAGPGCPEHDGEDPFAWLESRRPDLASALREDRERGMSP